MKLDCASFKRLGGFFFFFSGLVHSKKKKKWKCSKESREPGGREPREAAARMSMTGGPGAQLSAV